MKELNIEEKAKRYDEAIEKAKSKILYADKPCFVDIKEIFPELSESEDERIRKNLLGYIKGVNEREVCKETLNEWIAWLEKQGKKDEEVLILKDQIESLQAAIKAVKETHRIELEKQGEQKPAWSEEDENRINRLIAYFEDKESFTAEDDIAYANWLKSLKPQNRWKPSDEQMDALDAFIEKACEFIRKGGNRGDAYIVTEFGEEVFNFVQFAEDFKNYMKGG